MNIFKNLKIRKFSAIFLSLYPKNINPIFDLLSSVTSFGEGCARNFPGIYSKVTEPFTINWIHQMLSKTGSNVCENPEDSFLRRILMF